jgi:zinc D-Ala-D-Ala carboxypeptidase
MITTKTRRRAAPVSTKRKAAGRPRGRTRRPRAQESPVASIIGALAIALASAMLFLGQDKGPAPMAQSAPAPQETVTLSGREYPVPAPWKGHFVGDEPSTVLEDPALIPARWSEGGATLYLARGAKDAFVAMAEAAEKDGVELKALSGYRSFGFQRKVLESRLDRGQDFDAIARWTAPPGYSRHALGTVVDLAPNNETFLRSPAYRWLKGNAGRYGFAETYTQDARDGFPAEPWHWEWTAVAAR